MKSKEVREKHNRYLFPAVANYYKEPAVMVEGNGARIRDLDGREYLDFFGGILTVSVGHANPEVQAAVVAQAGRLSHVSTLYPTLPMVELAEKLVNLAPGKLDRCFFTASGTEADEFAFNLAQVHTGNMEVIALRHGYSGRSTLAQSLTAHASWRAVPTQIAAVKHALAPYCYRCPLRQTYPGCGIACAHDVKELIQTTTTGKIAGMLVEPILGVGGFITPPKEYFEIVADIVRQHGGVFIADEVQTGFGRTGKDWGIQNYGVEPDMMTMAKGIANGLPLGAVIATTDIAMSMTKNTISTFGGNPISCASANATLDIIQRNKLAANCEAQGQVLREGLLKIQASWPKLIGDVRGMGLMQALELVVDETAGDRTPNTQATLALFEETRRRGLLIGKGGLYGNVIRIAPMLNSTRDEIEEGVNILAASFQAMHQKGVGMPDDFKQLLSEPRLESQFSDSKPGYNDGAAAAEANRCLYCYDAPCIKACPTAINIPEFIRKIATGNIKGSARTIWDANILGYSCARVCPVEKLCVGACVYNDWKQPPIQIGRLQRYATEKTLAWEKDQGKRIHQPKPASGQKVALIGAGPASLACAAYLALEGIQPVIFEKRPLPGGLNTTGVAPYKMPSNHSLDEVAWLLGLGIEVKTGVEVGRDISFQELLDQYEALFIGVGLGGDRLLRVPPDDPGVMGATSLIERIKNNSGFTIPEGVESVAVIGGGNTAIDIARELAMLGVPRVGMYYRRSEREMSGYDFELRHARDYGVIFHENCIPTGVDRRGEVLEAHFEKNGTSFSLACDWVVFAIGQERVGISGLEGVTTDDNGRIRVDIQTCRTGHPKVYAGGDCVNGGKEVVNAVAHGRDAARAMIASFGIQQGGTQIG